ncbi:MAG: hypothetical protein AB1806_06850 [Acidobacteriota bacterium]
MESHPTADPGPVSRSGRFRPGLLAAAAAGVYVAFFGAFFHQSFTSGNYVAPSDSLDFGVSAFLSIQSFWTGAMYSGYPIAADPQALMWYPLFRAARAIQPSWLGWNLFLLSAYPIAAFTCFLLVRLLTGSFLAALFSGLMYGLSGPFLAHVPHFNPIPAAAWVPLVFVGLHLLRTGRIRAGILVGSVAIALSVLAGHPQEMVYGVYLAGAYVVYNTLRRDPGVHPRLRILGGAGATFAVGFGLAAILLVPARELASFGERIDPRWEIFVSKSFPVSQLVTLLFPLSYGNFRLDYHWGVDYFGESSPGEMTGYFGILPLLIVLMGTWRAARTRPDLWFWAPAAVVGTLLALGDATPLARLAFHLPLYGSFRVPARHFFVVALSVAVAAGIVLAHLSSARDRWQAVRRVMTRGFLLAGAVAMTFVLLTPHARQLVLESRLYVAAAILMPLAVIAIVWIAARLGGRLQAPAAACVMLIMAVHAVEVVAVHYAYPGFLLKYAEVPPSGTEPRSRIQSLGAHARSGGFRILAADGSRNAFVRPNLTRAWGIPAATGTGSMAVERYTETLRLGGPGDAYPDVLGTQHVALDLWSVRYALVPDRWKLVAENRLDPRRWTVLDRLQWREDDPDSESWLVENNRARPRAWLVGGLLPVDSRQALQAIYAGRMSDGRAFDPAHVALVDAQQWEGDSRAWPAAGGECGHVATRIISDSALDYEVDASGDCYLVLSEVFYPWWKATVNGEPAALVRTNYAMLGLPVRIGPNKVSLRIVPASLWLGARVSLATGGVWLGIAFAAPAFRRYRQWRVGGAGKGGLRGRAGKGARQHDLRTTAPR